VSEVIMGVQCGTCRHLLPMNTQDAGKPDSEQPKQARLRCTAFPGGKGIPDAILTDEADHRQPYDGDRGVRWEPQEPRGREQHAYAWPRSHELALREKARRERGE
jgi:hypothetical protein